MKDNNIEKEKDHAQESTTVSENPSDGKGDPSKPAGSQHQSSENPLSLIYSQTKSWIHKHQAQLIPLSSILAPFILLLLALEMGNRINFIADYFFGSVWILIFAPFIFVFVLLLVSILIVTVYYWIKKDYQRLKRLIGINAILLLLLILHFPFYLFLQSDLESKIAEGKAFINYIEEYHAENGQYPEQLPDKLYYNLSVDQVKYYPSPDIISQLIEEHDITSTSSPNNLNDASSTDNPSNMIIDETGRILLDPEKRKIYENLIPSTPYRLKFRWGNSYYLFAYSPAQQTFIRESR